MNGYFNLIPTGSDRIIRLGFAFSFIFAALSLAFILINFSSLPPLLPLFNQLSWGEQRLGTKEQIFIPVAISFGILIINFSFSQFIYQKTPLVARILCGTSVCVSFFAFLFITHTIRLIL